MGRFRRFAKRAVKKVGRALKRRYFKGKGYGNPNVSQMASDVMMLKKLVNAEKKHTTIAGNLLQVAQLNQNVSGYYAIDITPVPTAGLSEIQRTGTSIKLVSSYMKFQFQGQANAINRTKFKILIIQNSGERVTNVSTWVNDRLKANPFVTGASIVDYNSSWNNNTFGGFRVIRQAHFTMSPDSITNEVNLKTITLPMKYNRGKGTHIRYQSGTNTPANHQLFMVVLADTGNYSTVNASGISGVAQLGASTGFTFQFYATHYYIDN